MQPIVKQRIDNSVYEQLLTNIKNGVWKSGEKLPSEAELCQVLQVSRVSVRSALQKLQALGYIEVKRAVGSFVCGADDFFDLSNFANSFYADGELNLTRKEFHDIVELREMIEESSIRILLAMEASPDLSRLTKAYEGMVQAVEDRDLKAFTLYDHHFHMAIIIATGNEKFIQIAQIFREDFYRYLNETNRFVIRREDGPEKYKGYFEMCLVWHTKLHAALVRRDPEAMEIQRRYFMRNVERMGNFFQLQEKKISGRR